VPFMGGTSFPPTHGDVGMLVFEVHIFCWSFLHLIVTDKTVRLFVKPFFFLPLEIYCHILRKSPMRISSAGL